VARLLPLTKPKMRRHPLEAHLSRAVAAPHFHGLTNCTFAPSLSDRALNLIQMFVLWKVNVQKNSG
jgi:hypothetical protein